MTEEIFELVTQIGVDSLRVVYFYIIVDTIQVFFFLGLGTYGVRAVWKQVKRVEFPEEK